MGISKEKNSCEIFGAAIKSAPLCACLGVCVCVRMSVSRRHLAGGFAIEKKSARFSCDACISYICKRN